jgi:hypothetical protein
MVSNGDEVVISMSSDVNRPLHAALHGAVHCRHQRLARHPTLRTGDKQRLSFCRGPVVPLPALIPKQLGLGLSKTAPSL